MYFVARFSVVLLIISIINTVSTADDVNSRLKTELLALGFANGDLPTLTPAFGNYVDVVEVGTLLYLSSAAPQAPSGSFVKGRVPDQLSVAQAINASKYACVRQVNRLKNYLGDLKRVKKIVYVRGKIVTKDGTFQDHTAIIDGCSAFLVNVFGNQTGRHARTSDGLLSLPLNVTLEIELIAERNSALTGWLQISRGLLFFSIINIFLMKSLYWIV